jgi:DNA polymerase-1
MSVVGMGNTGKLSGKLMLIDGNSILNRAFYGIRGPQLLSTSDGLYTNAVYGFVNILLKYLDEEKPQYICVAFDMKAPTFRHEQYDGYKAKRKGMPDELAVQVPVIKEVLDAMNIKRIEYEGYEADDIIGWLSRCGEKKGMEVVIVTGDRDALQLVSALTRVKLPTTRHGKTQTKEYDYNSFLLTNSIRPQQLIDVKALMGDASDNIPGVKGIGEKTAFDLIREFGSIEVLYDNIDRVRSKNVKEKLKEGKEAAFLSKKLATIKRSLPEELCNVEQLMIREYDSKKLYDVFRKLEFNSLIDRLELRRKIFKDTEEKEGNNSFMIIHAVQPKEMIDLKNIIAGQEEISFYHLIDKYDFEENTTLAGNLSGLALSWGKTNSAYIKIGNGIREQDFVHEFKDIFENKSIKKIGHNVKSFLVYLKCAGVNIKGLVFDTMIASYILSPSKDTYTVSELSSEYLYKDIMPIESLAGKGKNHVRYGDIQLNDIIPAATGYSQAIHDLRAVLEQSIKKNQQEALYYDIEMPLAHVLANMEFVGFRANKNELAALSREFEEKIGYLEREIYNMAGEEFNINSPKQLGIILFEKLKLPAKKRTKTGYSTDAEVLEQLAKEHRIVSFILEYRKLMKLKSTYTDGLIGMINPKTGKIHSRFNQTVVVTGRISSTEPNLQNIPVKLEMGRKIRRVFEPFDGNFILTDADYSQIELRVLAHISGDENLIAAFINNEDIHRSTASKVFGIPMEKVTPLLRNRAKAVNFGIIYGIGDFSLAKDLGITRKEARKYINDYLDKYPGVRQYMHDIVVAGKEQGYVTTIFNRRRYLPELSSNNHAIRAFGERIALNAPIQGSAADIIKIAMVKVYNRLENNNMKSRLILQVHDELLVETHVDEKDEVVRILRECMETAVTLKVPLVVDIKTGRNWYEVT